MRTYWEIPNSPPAEYLAWDEAFLEECEVSGAEVLWFWESLELFVVVGYGQQIAKEVEVAACKKRGVPILRRCSGGGAVVQGPGCLNYGIVLRINSRDSDLLSVTGANRAIMENQCRALRQILGSSVAVAGHTDLVLGDRKFSGNAQRRRQNCLLFHGTILTHFDLECIGALLRNPTIAPEYRAGRPHQDFVANCGLKGDAVQTVLRGVWNAHEPLDTPARDRMLKALGSRYGDPSWHWRR